MAYLHLSIRLSRLFIFPTFCMPTPVIAAYACPLIRHNPPCFPPMKVGLYLHAHASVVLLSMVRSVDRDCRAGAERATRAGRPSAEIAAPSLSSVQDQLL